MMDELASLHSDTSDNLISKVINFMKIEAILIASITSGLMLATFRWWGQFILRLLNKKTRRAGDAFPYITQIYDAMMNICIESSAERVLVLKTEDGGGLPGVGATLYGSVVYEYIFNQHFDPLKQKYQRFMVDEHYLRMLQAINKKDEPYVFVTDKEPDSLLKTVYDSLKVTHSYIYYLGQSKKAFYYMSVVNTQNHDFEVSNDKVVLQQGVSLLRNIFKLHAV